MRRYVTGIDHLTLVANELKMASTLFQEELGFSIGETGYYTEKGTYYSAIHFRSGGDLELLAPHNKEVLGEDGLAWFDATRGPGSLAMGVTNINGAMEYLRSKDLMVSAPNIGTTHYTGVKSPKNLWSAIGFMEDVLPGSIYFIEKDENAYDSLISEYPFLNPDQFIDHPNSVERIRAIWIQAEEIELAAMSFSDLGFELSEIIEIEYLDALSIEVTIGDSSIILMESVRDDGHLENLEPCTNHGVIGFTVMVQDIDTTCKRIQSRNIEIGGKYSGIFGESVILHSSSALGTIIEFTSAP
ncbi:MAG: VOC family protein [Candidatus Thorarchaeota archaeon]